jgi:AmmeMemoRadiSam system protein A
MTPDERETLLSIAKDAVAATVENRPLPTPPALTPALEAPGAAFVTLRCEGDLRGCIGHTEAREALWQSVQDMASAAAERDSRFTPVAPHELARLTIGISVLTPMRRARAEEVEVGRHGLYLRLGRATGLLLPQVAIEWRWDRAEFLRQTCRKAGLAPDAFLDPACEIYVFEAEVFGEE